MKDGRTISVNAQTYCELVDFHSLKTLTSKGSIFNQWESIREQRWSDVASLESDIAILWGNETKGNRRGEPGALASCGDVRFFEGETEGRLGDHEPSRMRRHCFEPRYKYLVPHLAAVKIAGDLERLGGPPSNPLPNVVQP